MEVAPIEACRFAKSFDIKNGEQPLTYSWNEAVTGATEEMYAGHAR